MDDKQWKYVYNALRRASLKTSKEVWNARQVALRDARIERGVYLCAHCNGRFGPKEIDVDHILPVIPLNGSKSFDEIIPRLFCDSDNLQVLCKPCHKTKSKAENKLRFEYRKLRK